MIATAVAPSLEVAVRRMRPGDEPFVFRSWLKSCRRCERHRNLPSSVYYGDAHEQVERLLAAPVVAVHLAVAPADATQFYGFICTEILAGATRILHFAFVKGAARRRGVFRSMARGAGLDLSRAFFYTAHPYMASAMAERFPTAVYRRDVLALPR